MAPVAPVRFRVVAKSTSRLAQLVERKTLNLVVVGSSPTVGVLPFFYFLFFIFDAGPRARAPFWLQEPARRLPEQLLLIERLQTFQSVLRRGQFSSH